ncbi:hypothetical protein NGA_0337902 [Nannochloropsis gaditana CCMP526]|uniref:uncharacterized protein n=1 Tax=Nannochloropsis gaditana (strain CCMP526) TaxID=1093141 RepID=UPI00029F7F05|nr:hypothetical protein NGA_0337902 [Nannochloropsis gaditana CCMP526]EKU23339.1 hypothetical protein NGA_0337902 [Nannochloropsis gaditana CCMP526]|eukprot:XP_005852491.1 hypothetical protein NGA_0337902 [Nannochloropsis gaditana CCMP526]
MEDDRMQRLHDTLDKLRPRGKTGGLGFNSGFGPKKTDDGLPKNGLYAYFVRAGHGGYKKWGDDDIAEVKPESEGESSLPVRGYIKKEKRKKEKRSKGEDASKKRKDILLTASEKQEGGEPPRKRRRQRLEEAASWEALQNPQAGDATVAGDIKFSWHKHIKRALKAAEEKVPLRQLRKQVVALALERTSSRTAKGSVAGTQSKKALKHAFHRAVDTHDLLHVEDGVVHYRNAEKAVGGGAYGRQKHDVVTAAKKGAFAMKGEGGSDTEEQREQKRRKSRSGGNNKSAKAVDRVEVAERKKSLSKAKSTERPSTEAAGKDIAFADRAEKKKKKNKKGSALEEEKRKEATSMKEAKKASGKRNKH